MRIRITRDTFVRGEPVSAGALIDVDPTTFDQLRQAGKADQAPEQKPTLPPQPNAEPKTTRKYQRKNSDHES